MEMKEHCVVSRSHLLRMAELSQLAVSDAIKAYTLGSSELCRKVHESKHELSQIQVSISERGRKLFAEGIDCSSASLRESCSLRIYSALRLIHIAAIEMAQNTLLKLEHKGWLAYAATTYLSAFVNSLVRSCSMAMLKEETHHAKAVLQIEGGRRHFELWLYRAHEDLMLDSGAPAERELAISQCLGHIAEQSYEIADAVTFYLEDKRNELHVFTCDFAPGDVSKAPTH